MPTKRRRRSYAVRAALSPVLVHFLETGTSLDGSALEVARFRRAEPDLRARWQECRDAIVEGFADEHPGRRPWAWWRFNAP